MPIVETVQIKTPNGCVTINKSDLTDKDVLWEQPKAVKKTRKPRTPRSN